MSLSRERVLRTYVERKNSAVSPGPGQSRRSCDWCYDPRASRQGQLHVFPDSPIASVLHHSSGEVWRLQRQRVFHLSVRGVCHEF